MKNDSEFLEMLKAAFQVEAAEHIQTLNEGLLELEKTPAGSQSKEILETIFREAHTLKGASRAVDLSEVEKGCQWLEDVFSELCNGTLKVTPELFGQLSSAMDQIQLLADGNAPKESRFIVPAGEAKPCAEIVPAETASEAPPSIAEPSTVVEKAGVESLRIATWKLDELFLHAEEMLSAKLTTAGRAKEARDLYAMLEPWEKRSHLVDSDIRSLIETSSLISGTVADLASRIAKVVEHVEFTQVMLRAMRANLSSLARAMQQDTRTLDILVSDLLAQTKGLMLVPCSGFLATCPKLVRDLSRDQKKEVKFSMVGSEVEIDKRIVEAMRDTLLHLLRNAVDHGIELPIDRVAAGKNPTASLRIAVSRLEANRVEIGIEDDGGGIQITHVKAQAIKVGIISAEQAGLMSDEEAAALIFHSGLSTRSIITDISGRGLGMAIVRERIDKLGGQISIKTALGKGTTFRISLPVSLSTFQGILVAAGGQLFVIPSSHVDYVTRVSHENINRVAGQRVIHIKGRTLALVALEDLLGLPLHEAENGKHLIVLILVVGDAYLAVSVTDVLSEYEVVVKPLGYPLLKVQNIAGVTVIGTGKPALVLRVEDLLHTSKNLAVRQPFEKPPNSTLLPRILIAEDSITSRMLIKNILEMGGFEVTTAVDGANAWEILNDGQFVAVVSDVDMPRMNGFQLTEKIRADKRFVDLPVLLVTARETKVDRERGVDVGANAYIVKRNFEESNLVEVLRRLI